MAELAFNYNERQQYFCLSAAANIVGQFQGTQNDLQQKMQAALNRALPGLKGDWKVTWGPAVFKKNPDWHDGGPLNAWYVAKSESQNTYVVAIAGTASHNILVWVENFAFEKVVDFNAWVREWKAQQIPAPSATPWQHSDTEPLIADGTSFFTHNVLSHPSPHDAASSGLLLGDYLHRNVGGAHVVFAGHSMGGAVSPVVALGLQHAGLLEGAASVRALPSAGPTPGNKAFAADFAGAFPPLEDGSNTDLFNTLDIVPQAFGLAEGTDRHLGRIVEMWNGKTLGPFLRSVVKLAYGFVHALLAKTVPYANLPGRRFTGARPLPVSPIRDLKAFLYEVMVQHIDAYWVEIGIEEFVHTFEKTLVTLGLVRMEFEDAIMGEEMPLDD